MGGGRERTHARQRQDTRERRKEREIESESERASERTERETHTQTHRHTDTRTDLTSGRGRACSGQSDLGLVRGLLAAGKMLERGCQEAGFAVVNEWRLVRRWAEVGYRLAKKVGERTLGGWIKARQRLVTGWPEAG